MADEIKYVVTSCVEDEAVVTAIVDGVKTKAKVPCLVVEGSSSDGSMGHTFRLRGADAGKYKVGSGFTAKLIPDEQSESGGLGR